MDTSGRSSRFVREVQSHISSTVSKLHDKLFHSFMFHRELGAESACLSAKQHQDEEKQLESNHLILIPTPDHPSISLY